MAIKILTNEHDEKYFQVQVTLDITLPEDFEGELNEEEAEDIIMDCDRVLLGELVLNGITSECFITE